MAAWRIRACSFAGSYGQAPHTATFVFWASGGQQDGAEFIQKPLPLTAALSSTEFSANALPSLVDQWSRQAQRDEAHAYATTVSPSALLLQVRTSLIPSVAVETRKPSSSPSESMIHGV